MNDGIYLDWNATSPPHPDVIAAMGEAAREAWANPASVHSAGRKARARIEETRELIGQLCEVHARDVLFTSGGTEANNLALSGAAGLITSRLEHPSVVRVAEALVAAGRPVKWLDVTADGRVDVSSLSRSLADMPEGTIVAVMAANHETGVIQPISEIASLTRQAGVRLHVDAVQAIAKLDPNLWRHADSVTIAAHKIRGPKGIGALAWRGKAPKPILLGGSQERGLRPGTVDPISVSGFLAALRRVETGPARYAELGALRDSFERTLAPLAVVNGAEPRLPHVSNLSFPGWKGDELVAALDLLGVFVSSGSACSAGTAEVSPVISSMLGVERARSAVRISLGDATTASEVERAAQIFARVIGASKDLK
jgi:cysteine desulfurase